MDTLIRVRRPLAVMVGLGLTAMLLIGAGSVGAAPGDLDTKTMSSPATTTPATTVASLPTTTRSPARGMVTPRPVYIG